MKKLFLFIAMLAIGMMAMAQNPLSYDFVVQKEGVPATQIYDRVMDWIATNFKSAGGDFYHDKESLTLTKDAAVDYEPGGLAISCYKGTLTYKLKVQCRDGRFKVQLTNFTHANLPKNSASCNLGLLLSEPQRLKNGKYDEKVWNELKALAEAQVEIYRNAFENMSFDTEEDNW